LKDLAQRNVSFERQSEKYALLEQSVPSTGPGRHDQLGNERHFIGVFSPQGREYNSFLLPE
jgi:hypothetical protein